MWVLINWANDDGSDICAVNDAEGSEDSKLFDSEAEALEYAKTELNFHYKAIEL